LEFSKTKMSLLNDVSLVVTAGSRPGYLKDFLTGAMQFLPEATCIVVNDDDKNSYWFTNQPPKTIWEQAPRDTFLTRKRNLGVQLVDTKYTLLMADDFVVDAELRRTIIKMANILEMYNRPDVVAGTFNSRPYEGHLEVVEGEYIREHQLDIATATPFALFKGAYIKNLYQVDLAANFFLGRTRFMQRVPWDETIGPIGGEHADWFLDVKAAGGTVVWTPGLTVFEQEKNIELESPDYGRMRSRVWDGHKLMLKKRGVKKYVGFGETP
jgi:hypothetical protein